MIFDYFLILQMKIILNLLNDDYLQQLTVTKVNYLNNVM